MIPAVVVPGFWGFVRESDGLPGEGGAAALLESLWLSLLEGREEQPGSYLLAGPEEGVLVPEVPPDPSLEALAGLLPQHAASQALGFFVYDWRRDLVRAAGELAAGLGCAEGSLAGPEIDLVGIGPGALVVRRLIESGEFPEASARVRRVVLLGTPGAGIPAGVLLLNGVLGLGDPGEILGELLASFPAALQLLPPRDSGALHRAGSPGARIDLLRTPEALLAGTGSAALASLPAALLELAAERNEALHGRLARAGAPTWERTLALASAGHATYSELELGQGADGPCWVSLRATPASGDGLVPIVGAIPHPSVRHVVTAARHLELASDRDVARRLETFLLGPLS